MTRWAESLRESVGVLAGVLVIALWAGAAGVSILWVCLAAALYGVVAAVGLGWFRGALAHWRAARRMERSFAVHGRVLVAAANNVDKTHVTVSRDGGPRAVSRDGGLWGDGDPAFLTAEPLSASLRPAGTAPSELRGRSVGAWRPAETAPRDGTPVLLWHLEYGVAMARCSGSVGYSGYLASAERFVGRLAAGGPPSEGSFAPDREWERS